MTKKRNANLDGNAPSKSDAVLLLIDVINDFNFPEADQLLEFALPAAKKLRSLTTTLCRKWHSVGICQR